jgi:hypothetical protein
MKSKQASSVVHRTLRRLESRCLALILASGAGIFLLQTCGLLLSLYALDRLFEPPREIRLVLIITGMVLWVRWFWKGLLSPLGTRPSARDLAAIWERSHPHLAGLLTAAVEIPSPPAGTSSNLLQKVHEEAELARQEGLEAKSALPASFSIGRLLKGMSALLCLVLLGTWQPEESSVFLNHLLGGKESWPRATQLVLLPPRLEGGRIPPAWEALGPEEFRLSVAASSTLSLRIRAEGKVPENVWALSSQRKRKLRSVGGGEFVLRLPPLLEPLKLRFEGGDDTDGTPIVHLLPGRAPGLEAWLLQVTPPTYMALEPWRSDQHEVQVPQRSKLELEFKLSSPAEEVTWATLDGNHEILVADSSGTYRTNFRANSHGEATLSVQGSDGFVNPRAAMLRWQIQEDRPPEAEVLFPSVSWATLPSAHVPVRISVRDDFGLAGASLQAPGLEDSGLSLELRPSERQKVWFEKFQVPEVADSNISPEEGTRFRIRVIASDAAPPAGQVKESESPWIEVMTPEELENHHADAMVRVRERIEKLLEVVSPIARGESPARRAARTLRQNTRRIQDQLALVLAERVYANLDSGNQIAQSELDLLLREGAESGFYGGSEALIHRLASAPLLERSAWVRDLALAVLQAQKGAMNALLRSLGSGGDTQAPAVQLEAELRSMLDALLEWEDFQSAINLLRGLLERQRAIHLQTIESANR